MVKLNMFVSALVYEVAVSLGDAVGVVELPNNQRRMTVLSRGLRVGLVKNNLGLRIAAMAMINLDDDLDHITEMINCLRDIPEHELLALKCDGDQCNIASLIAILHSQRGKPSIMRSMSVWTTDLSEIALERNIDQLVRNISHTPHAAINDFLNSMMMARNDVLARRRKATSRGRHVRNPSVSLSPASSVTSLSGTHIPVVTTGSVSSHSTYSATSNSQNSMTNDPSPISRRMSRTPSPSESMVSLNIRAQDSDDDDFDYANAGAGAALSYSAPMRF